MNKILNDFLSNKGKYILYVDGSGSIGPKQLKLHNDTFTEIKNKIEDNLLVGYFDHEAHDLIPACEVDSIDNLNPSGGGTSFHAAFKHIEKLYDVNEIAGIIMLTDGYAEWLKESITNGIPVLWIIIDSDVIPPWGLYYKIK